MNEVPPQLPASEYSWPEQRKQALVELMQLKSRLEQLISEQRKFKSLRPRSRLSIYMLGPQINRLRGKIVRIERLIFHRDEKYQLGEILNSYQEQLGPAEIETIGGHGYAVWFTGQDADTSTNTEASSQSEASGKWTLYDFDGTLVDTDQAKKSRLEQYCLFLQGHNINLDQEQIAQLMAETSSLAYYDHASGTKNYSPTIHRKLLQLATYLIVDRHLDCEQALKKIRDYLSQTDFFQLLNELNPWDKYAPNIEQIFQNSIYQPSPFPERVTELESLSTSTETEPSRNLGIFTKGDPVFQLSKVLDYLIKHPAIKVMQIWLTKVDKGQFLLEFMETDRPIIEIMIYDDKQDQVESIQRIAKLLVGVLVEARLLDNDN